MTTGAGDNNGYETGSANLFAFDSAVATDASSGTGSSQSCTSSQRDKENVSGFSLGVPGAAAIKGIAVQVRGRVSSTSSSPQVLRPAVAGRRGHLDRRQDDLDALDDA